MNSIFDPRSDIQKSSYSDLFDDLLTEIDQNMQADLSELERFQNCFWVSVRHYKNLKQLVLFKGFDSEREEIDFFREIKPKVTCFIEFFAISSEALWFANDRSDCLCLFWKEEERKYRRFCDRFRHFIRYYESGKQDREREYFLRATSDGNGPVHSRIFDEHPALHSSKDWLVRSYLANKMYFRFVKQKLETIAGVQNERAGCQRHERGNNRSEHKDLKPGSGSFSQLLLQYMNWFEPDFFYN